MLSMSLDSALETFSFRDCELSDAVFGVTVNEHLVHMAVVQQLANNRQGTQKAKTRSEVSGVLLPGSALLPLRNPYVQAFLFL